MAFHKSAQQERNGSNASSDRQVPHVHRQVSVSTRANGTRNLLPSDVVSAIHMERNNSSTPKRGSVAAPNSLRPIMDSSIVSNVSREDTFNSESEDLSDITNEPSATTNEALTRKIHEYVTGVNSESTFEEINVAVKTYWRTKRRETKEADKWDDRKMDARRRKSKRDKCQRRINTIHLVDCTPEEKEQMREVLMTLPIDSTQSTEESGEEDDPFSPDHKVLVKVVRKRKWESQAFRDLKKKCDSIHTSKQGRRSHMPRKSGSYSVRQRPNVVSEFGWIVGPPDGL